MSEELIIRHCSPTLAGIKTGSIFSCPCDSIKNLRDELCALNKKLQPKGLRIIPLKLKNGRALIYIYRPNRLKQDLAKAQAKALLEANGYPTEKISKCIICLIQKLQNEDAFPHEIGLFLSYPPEDVYGFIQNNGCAYKYAGCWKVYGNEEATRKTFAKYQKCISIYYSQWKQGKPIERLTVAD